MLADELALAMLADVLADELALAMLADEVTSYFDLAGQFWGTFQQGIMGAGSSWAAPRSKKHNLLVLLGPTY